MFLREETALTPFRTLRREAVTEGIPPTVTLDTLTIAEGLYNVELEAKAVYHSRLKTPSTVRGNLMNHTIVQDGADVASSCHRKPLLSQHG